MCPVSKPDTWEFGTDWQFLACSKLKFTQIYFKSPKLNIEFSAQLYKHGVHCVCFKLVIVLYECPEHWICLFEWAIKSSVAYFITVNMGVGALFQSAFWSAAATILAWVVVTLYRFRVQ